jgi:hypothetical protein
MPLVGQLAPPPIWYFDKASLILAVACGGAALIFRRKSGPTHAQIGYLVESLLAGYSIPKGFYIAYCAFDSSALVEMIRGTEHQIFLIIGGLCVVYLAVITLKTSYSSKPKP